ncbi:MAG: endonuclease/exonuclease/phosphatase family protein [Opitutaceae bacterium]
MEFRIANWNIERPQADQTEKISALIAHMQCVDADIWILTESNRQVVPAPGYHSQHSGQPDRPSGDGEVWCSIWSRYELEDLNTYVSDPARCTAARLQHPTMGGILVYGLILPWHTDNWQNRPNKDGVAFTEALKLYQNDWRRLTAEFPDDLLIVAGDFNQNVTNEHYYGSALRRERLQQAMDADGLRILTSYESDPISRDSPDYACIDHICVSKRQNLKLIETTRWPDEPKPDRKLSDHFGVSVLLEASERML